MDPAVLKKADNDRKALTLEEDDSNEFGLSEEDKKYINESN